MLSSKWQVGLIAELLLVTSSSAARCCSAACTALRTSPAQCTAAAPSPASAAAETKSFSPFRIPRVSPAAEVQLNIKNCVRTILHPMLHTAVLQALNYLMMICFPFHLLHRKSQLELLVFSCYSLYVCLTSDQWNNSR